MSTPFSPPSGPAKRLFQEPSAKSQFLQPVGSDDIFGELDPQRRNALLHHLPGTAQKWITTTHLGWLAETPGLHDLTRLRAIHGGCAAGSS
jgi:hypothetical protein